MAAPKNPYAMYANNKVLSASQEELTLMLYDGAVRFSKTAYEAMQNKDVEKSHVHIVKTENIILELQMTLNRKYEVAKTFDDMYQAIYEKLVFANMKQDTEVLGQAVELIIEMRDLWKEAMLEARKQKAAYASTLPTSTQG